MYFSLSSSLVGSAVSNPDKLALDLRFATDKTLTARKGPTPAFTRASSGTFVGSNGLIQSAGNNVARFDHDPVTLACKGLLIEESRTNNCYNSNLLTSASWSLTGATIATSDTAPDGSSAFEITETLAVSGHNIANTGGATSTPAASITSGVTYTLSVFAKKSTGSVDWIQLTGTGVQFGTAQYANFNLATGAIGNYTGVTSGTVPKMEQFPNGWWRCSMTLTATATGTGNAIPVQFTNNTDTTTRAPSYLGSTANKVKLAMAQFEAGSFATSYIPNVGSSGVIRSADVCSISGSAFSGFYNPLEGSLSASAIFNAPLAGLTGQIIVDINDTTANNRTRFIRNASTGFLQYANTVGGTQDVTIAGSTAMITGAVTKIAGCMKANDFTIYLNNVSQGVDTTCVMQTAPTTFTIGDVSSGLATRAFINGTISSIRYYRKRLPNAKLQALTV